MSRPAEFVRGEIHQCVSIVPELFRNLRQVIDILERLSIEARSARPEAVVKQAEAKAPEKPTPSQTVALTYSIKEVSKQTGLSRSRIYRAIALEELRAMKYGKRTLVRAEDLRAWIDSWPTVRRNR